MASGSRLLRLVSVFEALHVEPLHSETLLW